MVGGYCCYALCCVCLGFGCAISLDTAANSGNLGLMYCWYAMLDQRPNNLIVVSGTPAWLAEVAAPIRKLWPLK